MGLDMGVVISILHKSDHKTLCNLPIDKNIFSVV